MPSAFTLRRRRPTLPRRPQGRSVTSRPSASTTLPLASGRPARERHIWPWPWPSRPCAKRKCRESFSRDRPSKPGRPSGFCREIFTKKSRPICDRCMIEIAPLAYMRGRTLNHAFIILDEAQNSTTEQMFMFLTRLGHNSKAVITGDITQIDLPAHKHSGLVEARRALKDIDGIAIVEFQRTDVVRHALVQRIIQAYEEHRGTSEK